MRSEACFWPPSRLRKIAYPRCRSRSCMAARAGVDHATVMQVTAKLADSKHTKRGTFYDPIFTQSDRDQAAAASEYHHHRWSLGTHDSRHFPAQPGNAPISTQAL